MLGQQKQSQAKASEAIFMSSMKGLSNVLAVACTFFGTGPLYSATVGWVQGFSQAHYSASGDIVAILWGCVCAAFIFFVARASLSTALVMGALTLATRIF